MNQTSAKMIRGALSTVIAAIVVGASARPAEAIIGGTDAAIENLPFAGSLAVEGGHICGAVLIKPQVALTAAHCVVGQRAADVSIRFGSAARTTGGVVAKVDRIITHPNYNNTIDHDIAFLRLTSSLAPHMGSTIGVAVLSQVPPVNVGSPIIAGWGFTKSGSSTLSSVLKKAQVSIVNRTDCNAAYGGMLKDIGGQLTDSMFCIGQPTGDSKQFSNGDAGGPVVAGSDGSLIGLMSFSLNGYPPNKPQVATDIYSQRAWIADVIAKNVP